MKHLTIVAAFALVLMACDKKDPVPPPPTGGGSGARPEKIANGEPAVITIQHVLISFAGAGTKATRTKEEAQKLAYEVLNRAKGGEDFVKMMADLSDDGPDRNYTMVNEGINPEGEEFARSGPRGMVKGFGDVGFRIKVGEIGLSEHHPTDSPYGWHVIKRTK